MIFDLVHHSLLLIGLRIREPTPYSHKTPTYQIRANKERQGQVSRNQKRHGRGANGKER